MAGGEALRAAGIEPVVLEAKEGLALINGTQMMTAVGVLSLLEAENVSKAATSRPPRRWRRSEARAHHTSR